MAIQQTPRERFGRAPNTLGDDAVSTPAGAVDVGQLGRSPGEEKEQEDLRRVFDSVYRRFKQVEAIRYEDTLPPKGTFQRKMMRLRNALNLSQDAKVLFEHARTNRMLELAEEMRQISEITTDDPATVAGQKKLAAELAQLHVQELADRRRIEQATLSLEMEDQARDRLGLPRRSQSEREFRFDELVGSKPQRQDPLADFERVGRIARLNPDFLTPDLLQQIGRQDLVQALEQANAAVDEAASNEIAEMNFASQLTLASDLLNDYLELNNQQVVMLMTTTNDRGEQTVREQLVYRPFGGDPVLIARATKQFLDALRLKQPELAEAIDVLLRQQEGARRAKEDAEMKAIEEELSGREGSQ